MHAWDAVPKEKVFTKKENLKQLMDEFTGTKENG